MSKKHRKRGMEPRPQMGAPRGAGIDDDDGLSVAVVEADGVSNLSVSYRADTDTQWPHDVNTAADAANVALGDAVRRAPMADDAFALDPNPVETIAADGASEFVAQPEIDTNQFALPLPEPARGIGARLRAARESRGLSREDVARQVRIPAAVIADIEAERFNAMGASIYLRGYLRSYARVVELPEIVVDGAMREVAAATPTLMPSHGARPLPSFFARYWNQTAYAALTVMVIVPVWFLLRPMLLAPARAPDLAPIDATRAELLQMPSMSAAPATVAIAPPVTPSADSASESSSTDGVATSDLGADTSAVAAPDESPAPLMASLAPVHAPVTTPAPEVALTVRRVALKLTAPSWVEFIGADGQRLEFALLPAGTDRQYQLAGTADLRIGNVRGATLSIDGKAVDLVPYTRANVARLSIGGEQTPQH